MMYKYSSIPIVLKYNLVQTKYFPSAYCHNKITHMSIALQVQDKQI